MPLQSPPVARDQPEGAAEWYERGCALEEDAPEASMAAYRRALEIDPGLADAHLNLGRLLHERKQTAAAERHYRLALTGLPDDATAAYNLGVVLQDLGRLPEAIEAYETALARDASYADAHFNLAGVYERLGKREAAFRHLRTYRTLTRD